MRGLAQRNLCLGSGTALVKRWLLNNVDALELYALLTSLIGKSSASNGQRKDPTRIFPTTFSFATCTGSFHLD